MTTLTYRDRTLAADSRTTTAGTIDPGQSVKVRKLPDGRLVGTTGQTAEALRFVRWLEAGADGDAPALHDSRVVIVSPDGGIAVHEAEGFYAAEGSEFYAWGSGAAAALGALHVGATAAEAVQAATFVDPNSGGPVRAISL